MDVSRDPNYQESENGGGRQTGPRGQKDVGLDGLVAALTVAFL